MVVGYEPVDEIKLLNRRRIMRKKLVCVVVVDGTERT
jgi:hypothetical protein